MRGPSDTTTVPIRRGRRVWWIAAGGVVLLAAVAALLWRARALPITSIAVLPVSSAGEDVLARGVYEEIVDSLTRVPGLRVETQSTAQPPVDAIMESTLERADGKFRLQIHLSRTDGRKTWKRLVERPTAELNSLPIDAAAFISPEARKRASKYKPKPGAYDLYLEGRSWLGRDANKAIEAFQRATDADGGFAQAWAWLSIAREYLADAGAVRPNEMLPPARDEAERAVTIGPDLPDAHAALGIVKLQYDWDWDAARKELDRALQINPGSRLALYWRTRWQEATSRTAPHPLNFAHVPAIHGEADAKKLLQDADDIRVETYISPVALALVANSVHDTDNVFHWLDVAYDERSVQLPYALWDPALPRSDPRLTDLMQRMKLPPTE